MLEILDKPSKILYTECKVCLSMPKQKWIWEACMREEKPVKTTDLWEETIKSRPFYKKRLVKRALEVVAFAILFGFIAYITMLIASYALTEKLFPQPTNEVSFTEESSSLTTEEIEPEDMILQGEANANGLSNGQERRLEISDTLHEIAADCERWLVQVTSVSEETSWLDSTATSEKVSAGAIIADNGTELLVLVRNSYLEDANRIEIKFMDDTIAAASIKAIDKNLGLAVVAMTKTQISQKTLKNCDVVQMSSSNNKSLLGEPVIALGSPNGIQGSVCYGYLTAINVDVHEWDYNYHRVATDIYGTTAPNGFLVNVKGQLIGILCNTYNSEDTKNLVSAIGISEIKKRIEQISNGKEIPLLGVKGIEVPEEARTEQGVPNGAYVTSVKWDSPAMIAGIQPGDVIVKVGDKDIASMYYLSYVLLQKEAGEQVEVVIMRKGQGEYKERTLKITLANQ